MAVKKEGTVQFTKAQLLKSDRYSKYTDFLAGNLKEKEAYSLEQVEQLIKKHYGKVVF